MGYTRDLNKPKYRLKCVNFDVCGEFVEREYRLPRACCFGCKKRRLREYCLVNKEAMLKYQQQYRRNLTKKKKGGV